MTGLRRLIPGMLLLALAGCGAPLEPIAPGARAPEFRRPTLEGGELRLGAHAGEIVILNFWATWCQPCRREFPVLRELDSRPGITVLGVSLDEAEPEVVRRFVAEWELDWTIVRGDEELFQRYDGLVIPYTLLLDRRLEIVSLYRGPVELELLERDLAGIGP